MFAIMKSLLDIESVPAVPLSEVSLIPPATSLLCEGIYILESNTEDC